MTTKEPKSAIIYTGAGTQPTTIVTASPRVVIGVDTHLDTVHLALITDTGKPLADAEFPTCPAGYDDCTHVGSKLWHHRDRRGGRHL